MKCSQQISGQSSQFIRPESFLFSTSRNTVEEADGAPSPSIDRSPAPLNMALGVAFVLSLILVIGHHQEGPGSLAKTFTFPEYPYKETTKNVSRSYNSLDLSLTSVTCLKADTGYGEQPSFGGGWRFTTPGTAELTLIRLRLLNGEYMYIKTSSHSYM